MICSVPNMTTDGVGFYVSYNDVDRSIYGSDTTAIVDNGMSRFLILNGDHRAALKPLIPQGYVACVEYFRANPELVNKRSDKAPE